MSYDKARIAQVIKDGLFKGWSQGQIITVVMDLFGLTQQEAKELVMSTMDRENSFNLKEERRNAGASRYGKVVKNEGSILTPDEEDLIAKWKAMMDVQDYKVSIEDGKIRITGTNSKGQTMASNINRIKR